jgi:SAM-dependent methyltransferase
MSSDNAPWKPTFAEVEEHLKTCYPYLPTLEQIAAEGISAPISRLLVSRLTRSDIAELISRIPTDQQWKLRIRGERETLLVNAGTALLPHIAIKTGLPTAVPPPTVHRMQTGDPLWRGDLYSANMVAEVLDAARIPLVNGQGRILDFGCSSGSLLRVFAAAFPNTLWHGVDPVASSIDWAQKHISNVTLSQSQPRPPLAFGDHSMEGVVAISIWSHYSAAAACAWFSEMARIVKPGGFLVITYHSIYTLLWMCRHKLSTPDSIMRIFDELCRSGHSFAAAKLEQDLSFSEDWGQAYMTAEWLRAQTLADWRIVHLANGRNQFNQDIAVLVRI